VTALERQAVSQLCPSSPSSPPDALARSKVASATGGSRPREV
jgi:hypothetical protein